MITEKIHTLHVTGIKTKYIKIDCSVFVKKLFLGKWYRFNMNKGNILCGKKCLEGKLILK